MDDDEPIDYPGEIQRDIQEIAKGMPRLIEASKRLQPPENMLEQETYIDMIRAIVQMNMGITTILHGFIHLLTPKG